MIRRRKMSKAIQFGAGNIGRGFIGYLLSESGYEVVFADVVQDIIENLNRDRGYTIHIKDIETSKVRIENVYAVNSTTEDVLDEIEDAEIITTAVGPLVLKKIAPQIAEGIKRRADKNISKPLNIIACENAVFASRTLKGYVLENLDEKYVEYVERFVGFPSSSVDRIVPPSDNKNPLDVSVEAFYEFNVEKSGFIGEIPKIYGMNLVDNLEAYVERKLFTLNTGHAITAYLGNIYGYQTIDKSIGDEKVLNIVKSAMKESGDALISKYGFDRESHYKYIDKIINRFKNPYLLDDVRRVGREPLRKLSSTDRIVKPISTAMEFGLSVDNLCVGAGAGFRYFNEEDVQSVELKKKIDDLGIREAIVEVTGIKDGSILDRIEEAYNSFEK